MEFIIVLLLIYLIFKDDIREEINYRKEKKNPELQVEKDKQRIESQKREEAIKTELQNMMDYSINTAVDSKKRQV